MKISAGAGKLETPSVYYLLPVPVVEIGGGVFAFGFHFLKWGCGFFIDMRAK